MIPEVFAQIKKTLNDQSVDYENIINSFGQVSAYEERKKGTSFILSEHIKGLIYSYLSNQRPWGSIAENLNIIDEIFFYYDPKKLKEVNPSSLIESIRKIKCGNRNITSQINNLSYNIERFEKIESGFGSVDAFITSGSPESIASELGKGKKYKFKEVGFTLAMEYLRNVGINAIKPDLHICRIIGPERLSLIQKTPTPEEAYNALMKWEDEVDDCAIYIDNLLWIFAAKDYGNICSAKPKCHLCSVEKCKRKSFS